MDELTDKYAYTSPLCNSLGEILGVLHMQEMATTSQTILMQYSRYPQGYKDKQI